RVEIRRRSLAGTLARMQEHVLDDRVSALAVLDDLVEVAVNRADQLFRLLALARLERRALDHIGELADQLARQGREIIDEIERVLDLVGDAGGELAEGGELFRL